MRTKSTAVTFLTWVLVIAAGIYAYVARAEIVRDEILALSSVSAAVAAAMYFVMGCVRGFTLIPVTYLIPLGLQERYPGILRHTSWISWILRHTSGWISWDPEA